ncbi:hypothetical protein RSSM_04030 [Rhodopirellula sallentina SM41]|uniref:Uncharacterized protein n=1 Tax=Rhodopirellula sallentina SM41 TaxID=1263870 RepID=M5TZT8_9BACT|nr:hypothetical protein RSSM_04030 [Rhodopirellula sallentina SM41]
MDAAPAPVHNVVDKPIANVTFVVPNVAVQIMRFVGKDATMDRPFATGAVARMAEAFEVAGADLVTLAFVGKAVEEENSSSVVAARETVFANNGSLILGNAGRHAIEEMLGTQ